MAKIIFGTDGWRAVIGEEFTLRNVKVVSQAIAHYLKRHGLANRGVVVGYDTRKRSRRSAEAVCGVMLGNGIPTCITERDVPTPVTAFEVLQRNAGGAVMVTASHNTPEWNGIKYIPEYAGPALPEATDEITKNIAHVFQTKSVRESTVRNGTRNHLLQVIDPRTSYIEFVESRIDLRAIREASLKVVYDPMHGTARGYLDQILRDAGCAVTVIHGKIDPGFGGARPEPLPELLTELKAKVAGLNANIGLATDGDADRLAVYDDHGTYMAANQLFPMLYSYIIKSGKRGGVVRSLATTHLVDRIAEKHGLPVYEVPVGFKYVGQYLRERDVVIGGEESGGMGFKEHIPEKDGIFTGVKIVEMMARTGKSLAQLLDVLRSEYGPCVSGRVEVPCQEELKLVVVKKLSREVPDKIIGIKVSAINRMDGIKLNLKDGGWLLIRPSGTEPALRIYAESSSEEKLRKILEQGKNLVTNVLNERASKPR
jgi:alpha-D-glucose phosphate-specific phosphoglucomutase